MKPQDTIIKPKEKKERIVFYVNPEHKKALKKIAIDYETSTSNILKSIVSNYLEKEGVVS